MGEIYQKAAEQGIILSKKRILKFVRENVHKLGPNFSNIVVEKRTKGFVIKGARWSSLQDLEGTKN